MDKHTLYIFTVNYLIVSHIDLELYFREKKISTFLTFKNYTIFFIYCFFLFIVF